MAAEKRFPDSAWAQIVSVLSSSFSMDTARSGEFAAMQTPRFIAAIPFLAGCRKPTRTAIAHVAAYVIAGDKLGEAVFDHSAEDDYDVMARLASIANFEGGDPAIIARGMKILAKSMVEGYVRDAEADAKAGIYNPVNAKRWDAQALLAQLALEINAVANEEMDALVVKGTWWNK
jgi:hypothetical protein